MQIMIKLNYYYQLLKYHHWYVTMANGEKRVGQGLTPTFFMKKTQVNHSN